MYCSTSDGSVLIIVVIVLMILCLIGTGLMNLSLLNYSSVLNQDFIFYAYYIAESGVNRAKSDFKPHILDVLPYKFNYDDFQDYKSRHVKAEVQIDWDEEKELLIFESTGFVGQTRKKVEAGYEIYTDFNGDVSLIQKYFREKKLNTNY